MGISFFAFTTLLAVLLAVYYLIPKRFQWGLLLAASYVFYFLAGPKMVVFLLLSTLICFFAGWRLGALNAQEKTGIENTEDRSDKRRLRMRYTSRKRHVLIFALVANLAILVVLKYAPFFAWNLSVLFAWFNLNVRIPDPGFLLPLGISFYTFQSAGYLIDVYRGVCLPDRNPARFALFVSFFPQLVQGPISRYHQLAGQLYAPHDFRYESLTFGLQLCLWGLFKKLVIADRIAVVVNTLFNHYTEYEGLVLFLGAMSYCIQIYADFSGGIDVARGIAQMFGIRLVDNFRRPYFADSISDFWRRWHITLGAWMREYVFYPLSLSKTFARLGMWTRRHFGNGAGRFVPILLATMITFLAVGAWHGASWKFMVYGWYHGSLIFLAFLLQPVVKKQTDRLKLPVNHLGVRMVRIAGTFILVCFGRFFSRAAGLPDAVMMIGRTFSAFNPRVMIDGTLLDLGLDRPEMTILLAATGLLLAVDLIQERGIAIRPLVARQPLPLRWVFYLAAILSVLVFGVYGTGYDGATFIYAGL